MLKTRIIPTILYKDTTIVKGISFDSSRRIGSLMQTIKVYNMREVDELIFLDITATIQKRFPDFNLVDDFADECFVPLTVGGGIRTVNDAKRLLYVGADKIAINTAAVEYPDIVEEMALKFGSQCVVVSIDAKKRGNDYKVVTHSGKKETDIDVLKFAEYIEKRGAGEILLTSMDLDGTMKGYDIKLIKMITDAVSIPVIASGGAGDYEDMLQALKVGNASAVAASSIFHFTQQTPLEAKTYLKQREINVRF